MCYATTSHIASLTRMGADNVVGSIPVPVEQLEVMPDITCIMMYGVSLRIRSCLSCDVDGKSFDAPDHVSPGPKRVRWRSCDVMSQMHLSLEPDHMQIT